MGLRAERTRAVLLREAAQLFSVKGYLGTTVEDVMSKAQLTKGGFYAHFKSKEELGRAAIEHATEVWFAHVVARAAESADPRQQLRALLEAYRQYAVERVFEGGCFFINLSVEVDDQHPQFRELVESRFEQFRLLVASIVENGKSAGIYRADTPSEALGALVVGTLLGTMVQSKSRASFDLFDAMEPLLENVLASYEVRS